MIENVNSSGAKNAYQMPLGNNAYQKTQSTSQQKSVLHAQSFSDQSGIGFTGVSQNDNSPVTEMKGQRESQGGDFSVLQMSMLKHPPAANNPKKVMFKLEDTLHRSSQ